MRICYVSPYPPQTGGIEYQVQSVVSRLKDEHEIHVMTYGNEGRDEEGVVFHELPVSERYFFRGMKFVLEVMKRLKKLEGKIDIVHAHPLHPGGTAAAMMQLSNDFPLVMTTHGSDLLNYCKKYPSEFFRKIGDSTDNLVCVSRFLVDRARKIGISTQLNHVPNGVDSTELEALSDNDTGSGSILFVGSLSRHKRPYKVLSLARNYPGQQFDMIGDGPLRKDIEMLKSSKGLKNLNILGSRDRKETLQRIKNAKCLLVTSKYEGFGLAALEAMSLKTPVIASNVPALDELLTERSLCSDFDSSLDKVLNSERYREKMVDRNYEKSKDYTIDKKVNRLKKIYNNLVE